MAISFSGLKLREDEAIYIQVIRYFKKLIYMGELQNGDELPSRRVLAATLGINLTTIQKIYKGMEEEQLIETMQNSKTLIAVSDQRVAQLKEELVDQRMKMLVEEFKSMNLEFKDAVNLLTELWD